MMTAMEEVIFQPLYLFHPNQPGGVLVETQDVYDKLRAQGGWVESPAEFGVITAPNTDQAILQGAAIMPAPPPEARTTGPAVAVLETEVASLQALLTAVTERLEALEAKTDALTTPPEEDDTPHATRGRK
jgi:hypothetical protein